MTCCLQLGKPSNGGRFLRKWWFSFKQNPEGYPQEPPPPPYASTSVHPSSLGLWRTGADGGFKPPSMTSALPVDLFRTIGRGPFPGCVSLKHGMTIQGATEKDDFHTITRVTHHFGGPYMEYRSTPISASSLVVHGRSWAPWLTCQNGL